MVPKFAQKALTKGLTLILSSIFTVTGLLPVKAFAVENTVTLHEVIADVTKTDPTILESIKRYEGILAERGIAESEYYPTIGTVLSTGPERTDGVPTNDKQKDKLATTATLFARQNLYNGGRTTAFVAETDARILAAAYEVLNVANTVYLDCAEAYISVVKAKELLKIAEENALTQERIMRQVREKTEAGFNRVSELYNSESRLALAKASYISRQQDLSQALVSFHRQFGRFLSPEQFILPETDYTVPGNLPETVEIAFQRHPALLVAKYNIETRHYTYEKAAATDYPSLDFEIKGQYRNDTGGDNGDTTQSGAYLTLSYNFYEGGLRESEKARDQQAIRKEYQRSYIERRNVNETVRLAWNIMEAEDYKKKYLIEHVSLSDKTLEAFKEEYYVGRRTLLDLLNMENEYTQAKVALSDSKYSHLLALYRLMQSTGVLLEEYDPGLRNILRIPANDTSQITMYEGLDDNRDKDVVVDISDQCDNSASGAAVQPAGCLESDITTEGYPHKDGVKLSPYIRPQDFAAPADQ